jgi:hypothetical protein
MRERTREPMSPHFAFIITNHESRIDTDIVANIKELIDDMIERLEDGRVSTKSRTKFASDAKG